MTALQLPRLSILDLATVEAGGTIRDAFDHSLAVARLAESSGYERIWYAEHHNMPSIASSATSVLIAHIAANTERIGLGAGGVMLPNHAPLVIAEQFGTLAELHPDRIHLGLGRAPGTDGATFRALRRTHEAAENFPNDVLELQRYLSHDLPRNAVNAYPGHGTEVPLTILGSSMFGASLAAQLGLPYSFASHFAPQQLGAAVSYYRSHFVPSEANPEPYVSAGINVVAADDDASAEALLSRSELSRVRAFLSRGRERELTDDEAAELFDTPAGREIRGMLRFTAVGSPERVRAELAEFARQADVDELVTVHVAPTRTEQLESVRLTMMG